jgi:hypothetical protein
VDAALLGVTSALFSSFVPIGELSFQSLCWCKCFCAALKASLPTVFAFRWYDPTPYTSAASSFAEQDVHWFVVLMFAADLLAGK